jgi:hypothetical protein
MRQPAFLRLREDKAAREVVNESGSFHRQDAEPQKKEH